MLVRRCGAAVLARGRRCAAEWAGGRPDVMHVDGRGLHEDVDVLDWAGAGVSNPRRIKVPREIPGDVGERGREDYLSVLETAYGNKETWHRAEPELMRKLLPILARKVDDLREKLADEHRQQRLFDTAVVEALKEVPALREERSGSIRWTRDMIISDLKTSGIADSTGRLAAPDTSSLPPPTSPAPAPAATAVAAESAEATDSREVDRREADGKDAVDAAAEPPTPRARTRDPLSDELHRRRRRGAPR
eukprot:TRINITY_DN20714_c0_g1_i1.p1 TRINITY_DN20714_c0_g1~~TRINITY_DN20714_c0_g1_i1.p1  ORF type:complete len:264 (+),score=83.92 TRINITY_DN20714_c0_g1_i1:49-792(+)